MRWLAILFCVFGTAFEVLIAPTGSSFAPVAQFLGLICLTLAAILLILATPDLRNMIR